MLMPGQLLYQVQDLCPVILLCGNQGSFCKVPRALHGLLATSQQCLSERMCHSLRPSSGEPSHRMSKTRVMALQHPQVTEITSRSLAPEPRRCSLETVLPPPLLPPSSTPPPLQPGFSFLTHVMLVPTPGPLHVLSPLPGTHGPHSAHGWLLPTFCLSPYASSLGTTSAMTVEHSLPTHLHCLSRHPVSLSLNS